MSKKALIDRETLIARVKEVAAQLGRPRLTRAEFWRETGIPLSQVDRHFKSYSDLVRASGLADPKGRRITEEMLMQAMSDVFRAEGGLVPQGRYDKIAPYSINTYRLRFGSWRRAIAAFRQWVEQHAPDFPHLIELRAYCDRGIRLTKPKAVPVKIPDGRRYGELLRFGALEHAPVNEAGVVFLFALMAADLGFVVEALGPEFPDAEAKRRVADGDWRRVRIEFEYRSRSFQKHGHEPKLCDLIVCWENDWPQCPIEVLELRTAIRDLKAARAAA